MLLKQSTKPNVCQRLVKPGAKPVNSLFVRQLSAGDEDTGVSLCLECIDDTCFVCPSLQQKGGSCTASKAQPFSKKQRAI